MEGLVQHSVLYRWSHIDNSTDTSNYRTITRVKCLYQLHHVYTIILVVISIVNVHYHFAQCDHIDHSRTVITVIRGIVSVLCDGQGTL